jgi:hypothetical protein
MDTLSLYVVTENRLGYSKDSIVQLTDKQAKNMKEFVKPYEPDKTKTEAKPDEPDKTKTEAKPDKTK